MKYSVGDKVIARSDLVKDKYYGKVYCNETMAREYAGQALIVTEVRDDGYNVKENSWYWGIEMLEPAHGTIIKKGKDMINTIGKPKTKLEKTACKDARAEIISEVIDRKRVEYRESMREFISLEKKARSYRLNADELRDILGVSDAEMEQIFEG